MKTRFAPLLSLLFFPAYLHQAGAEDLSQSVLKVLKDNSCARENSEPVACARHSVVSVLPEWPDPAARNEEPEGSGIAVGDGHTIITANHVIGQAERVFVRNSAGQIFKAEISARDPKTDVAFLKLQEALQPLELAGEVKLASKACALGNSFGLDVSITCGVVSATGISGTGFNPVEDFVQTDAAVNPGMSGGALVDASGRLIGMLSAIFTKQGDANLGVNFAVSSRLLKTMLVDFQEDGKISHPRSGILVRPHQAGFEEGLAGAQIARIAQGSAEERAGLKKGDVILFAAGNRIKRAGAYEAALAVTGSGNTMKIQISRNGEMLDLSVNVE